jgi:sulfur carrier protein ThiS
MKTNIIIATLALITAPAFADSLKSREIRLDDCPPAVRDTILDNARNGTIEEVEHIRFGAQTLYVAEVDLPQNRDLEVHVDGSGNLVETREDLTLAELPASVNSAIQKLGGKPDDIERHIKGETTTYHAEIDRKGLPDLDVIISANGQIIEQTEEADA